MRKLLIWLVGLAALVPIAGALAETYPDRPVKLIVSYPAGGATDVIGRIVADALGERLGQRVVVENRGGAGGMVGAGAAAKSAPDGYTLIIATATTHAVNPALFKKTISYDALKDFTPISFVGSTPLVLMAHPSVPANTIPELIAYARSKGGEMSYATGGTGSVPHMAGELFNRMADISVKAVAYRGDAPATNDVLGGHLPYIFAHLPLALPLIQEGKLKALGVTTPERSAYAPNVPTIAEQGLPGYQIVTWWGVFGPAGMPADIVARLNTELRTILTDPAFKEHAFKLGYEVHPSSAEEFGEFVKAEHTKWGKIVIESGMKPD
jgi:tripartite-type tricarboxylate transporter receptor subunit TctC